MLSSMWLVKVLARRGLSAIWWLLKGAYLLSILIVGLLGTAALSILAIWSLVYIKTGNLDLSYVTLHASDYILDSSKAWFWLTVAVIALVGTLLRGLWIAIKFVLSHYCAD